MGYVRDVIEHVVVVKHDYRASYEAVRKAATDFPSLNVTAAWWDNSWHVTVGARPLRSTLLQGEACGLVNEQPSEDELRALAASVRALSYGTNLWGSADYRRCISASLAHELEGVQIPKFATDEYSCRRVPGVDSSEVR